MSTPCGATSTSTAAPIPPSSASPARSAACGCETATWRSFSTACPPTRRSRSSSSAAEKHHLVVGEPDGPAVRREPLHRPHGLEVAPQEKHVRSEEHTSELQSES